MNQVATPEPDESFDDDDLMFAEETETSASEALPAWKVMIADDDQDVHAVTKVIFADFSFKGRPLEFIDAYSGAQACQLLVDHPDTAVIFLDVVMESDHAGLEAAQRIREEIGNRMVRVILRTGQPGQAPEERVVLDYDINDYKSKTELTAQKLFTSLVAALRSYSDLKALDANRRGLMKVLDASSDLDVKSLRTFVSGMLMQLANLLDIGEDDICLAQFSEPGEALRIIAASGNFEPFIGDEAAQVLGAEAADAMAIALAGGNPQLRAEYGVYVVGGGTEEAVAAYVKGAKPRSEVDLALIGLFADKVLRAQENCRIFDQALADLDGAFALLGEVANPSYPDALAHARYVGMLSRDIAAALPGHAAHERAGPRLCGGIARAAMLCDIGNLALPGELWRMSGALDDRQREEIRSHPARGAALLDRVLPAADAATLELAREVVLSHHERFDGSGYPQGLLGTAIPLAGRIVAVADTFIALTSARPFRGPVAHEEALGIVAAAAGILFDPAVVDAFLEVADNYRAG